jgi:hypothetical protein
MVSNSDCSTVIAQNIIAAVIAFNGNQKQHDWCAAVLAR